MEWARREEKWCARVHVCSCTCAHVRARAGVQTLTLGNGSSVTSEPGSATGQAVVLTLIWDCERQCFQRGSHHRPRVRRFQCLLDLAWMFEAY